MLPLRAVLTSPELFDQSTAIHEAGHAVLFTLMGLKVRWVEMSQPKRWRHREKGLAYCLIDTMSTRVQYYHREQAAIGCLGGFTAQLRWGDSYDAAVEAATLDFENVDLYCPRAPTRLLEKAHQLTAQHWGSIHRVAQQLLLGRHLSGAEVRRVMREHS